MNREHIDELVDMLIAEMNAPPAPPTEEELAEERFVAEYPYTIGEYRRGADNESYRGTREPPLVVGLAEAGVKRMKAWLAKDMQWVDFALISAKRDRKDLEAMAASSEWSERGKPAIKLTSVQRKLVAKAGRDRHKYMQKHLDMLGYKHWITTVGKWLQYDDKGKPTGNPTAEYGFFVPNVEVAEGMPKDAPLKDRIRPLKDSAKFKRDMLAAGRAFTQQAVIARTDGKTFLYDTFARKEEAIKPLNDIYWGMEALRKMKEILGGGLTRPRATGDESEARFLMEVCAFRRAKARGYRLMQYSEYRGGMLTVD